MIDALREGKAPSEVRLKAAQGDLPLPPEERIEILVLLAHDGDEPTRQSAVATLANWNWEELERVLASPATSPDVLEFAAAELMPARPELLEVLLRNPQVPKEIRALLAPPGASVSEPPPANASAPPGAAPGADTTPAGPAHESPAPPADAPGETEPAGEETEDAKRETLIQRLGKMNSAERIKMALTGNQGERLALIRDSNKVVARAVLQSPKLSDGEIEAFASMKNVTEEVLRLIAVNRKFMKYYGVTRNLVNNPRSPIDITLPLLNRLNERDLKGVTLNKNIPEVIRGMATKMLKQKAEAAKPKLPGKH